MADFRVFFENLLGKYQCFAQAVASTIGFASPEERATRIPSPSETVNSASATAAGTFSAPAGNQTPIGVNDNNNTEVNNIETDDGIGVPTSSGEHVIQIVDPIPHGGDQIHNQRADSDGTPLNSIFPDQIGASSTMINPSTHSQAVDPASPTSDGRGGNFHKVESGFTFIGTVISAGVTAVSAKIDEFKGSWEAKLLWYCLAGSISLGLVCFFYDLYLSLLQLRRAAWVLRVIGMVATMFSFLFAAGHLYIHESKDVMLWVTVVLVALCGVPIFGIALNLSS